MHCIEGDKTVGDCLRECDKMRSEGSEIHNGDIIVVTGPLVSNQDVTATLKLHKEIKTRDKASIMTLALRSLRKWLRRNSV